MAYPRCRGISACPVCEESSLSTEPYSELLGVYLGDGISPGRRIGPGCWRCSRTAVTRVSWHVGRASWVRSVPAETGLPAPEQRRHGDHRRLAALAVPVPAARSRAQARAPDRARGLAAGRSSRRTPRLPARAVPLRRVPGAQLDAAAGRGHAEALRVPALAVHQRVRRHPRLVRRGAGPVDVPWRQSNAKTSRSPPAPGWPRLDELVGPEVESSPSR